jgi:hypothetical protein
MGYRSPLGEDEGSENFLSTIGCRPEGMLGFPALIVCVGADKFLIEVIFCIVGINGFFNSIGTERTNPVG